jgi:hypothetical protein
LTTSQPDGHGHHGAAAPLDKARKLDREMFGRQRRELEQRLARACSQGDLLAADVVRAERLIEAVTADVIYWRTRCERLIDAALAKRGEIDQPTMVEVPMRPRNPNASLDGVFAALGVTEIAGKRPAPASTPSLPGQAMSPVATDDLT